MDDNLIMGMSDQEAHHIMLAAKHAHCAELHQRAAGTKTQARRAITEAKIADIYRRSAGYSTFDLQRDPR